MDAAAAATATINGDSSQATTEGLPHLLDTFDAATLYREQRLQQPAHAEPDMTIGYVTVRQAEVLRKEYNTLLAEGPAKKRSPSPMPGDPEEILHAPAAPEVGLLDQHVEPEPVDPGLCEQAIDAAHIAQLEAVTPLLPMPPNRNVKALLNSLPDLPIFDLPKKSDMTYLQLRTVADACW